MVAIAAQLCGGGGLLRKWALDNGQRLKTKNNGSSIMNQYCTLFQKYLYL